MAVDFVHMVQSLHVFLHPSFRQSVHPTDFFTLRLSISVYISSSVSRPVHLSVTHSSNSRKITGICNHTTMPVLCKGALLGSWSLYS